MKLISKFLTIALILISINFVASGEIDKGIYIIVFILAGEVLFGERK